MSEQQQYEGDRWTTQSINILKELGLSQVGDSNFDIPCVNKAFHGTGKSEQRKNDHGIDSLFTYRDPYLNTDINVLVESKHRKWAGINATNLQSFANQLLMTIECANYSEKIQALDCNGVDTGLLMVWCSETEKYDYNKIKELLSQIEIPNKKKPITTYVATNEEILRWSSLIEHKKQIENESLEFNFFYPSDYYRIGKSMSSQKKHLNLIQLFSSYIFAKSKKEVEVYGGAKIPVDIHHVFFFAEPTKNELNFMYRLLTDFQFEDCHQIHIHFYGEQIRYREHIADFLRSKKAYFKENDSNLEIQTFYMNELKKVPEKYNVKED